MRDLDENWQNEHFREMKKDEIRTKAYYPILDSLVQGIDEQFSQEKLRLLRQEIVVKTKRFRKAATEFSVIPVTSASCERTFSNLVNVKNKLR
ncbi:hypothetical protein PR048_009323 [Dryococelus australis]|uniref:HAT C-terminal dimerisation domain-containing protein n=1 Tax=Dryococelus australis TaxID=614101 RepID=A0ABQ9HZN7_9NEOP|nr:hypothetical protein PR048_009323 [Dryococelus australis]